MKKPGACPGFGVLVEKRRIELPTFALRTLFHHVTR